MWTFLLFFAPEIFSALISIPLKSKSHSNFGFERWSQVKIKLEQFMHTPHKIFSDDEPRRIFSVNRNHLILWPLSTQHYHPHSSCPQKLPQWTCQDFFFHKMTIHCCAAIRDVSVTKVKQAWRKKKKKNLIETKLKSCPPHQKKKIWKQDRSPFIFEESWQLVSPKICYPLLRLIFFFTTIFVPQKKRDSKVILLIKLLSNIRWHKKTFIWLC